MHDLILTLTNHDPIDGDDSTGTAPDSLLQLPFTTTETYITSGFQPRSI